MMWTIAAACATSSIPLAAHVAIHAEDPLPPTGSVYIEAAGNGWTLPELERTASEIRLRDAAGSIVPTQVHQLGRHLRLTPRAPLQPGVLHIEQRFAYTDSHLLTLDQRRLEAGIRPTASSACRSRRGAAG